MYIPTDVKGINLRKSVLCILWAFALLGEILEEIVDTQYTVIFDKDNISTRHAAMSK